MPAVWLSTLKSGLACKAAGDRIGDPAHPVVLKAILWRIYPYIRPHCGKAIAGGVFIVLSTLAGFAPPLVMRYLVDEVILGRQMNLLAAAVLLLVACLAAEKLLRIAEDFCFARFEQQVLRDIQGDLLSRALAFPMALFDEQQTGYLTRRLTEDVEGLRSLFSGITFNAVGQALRLAGGIGFLFYLEWRIALGVLALLPGLAWGLKYFSGKIHLLSRQRLEHQAEAAGQIQESLAEPALIKAFAAETQTQKRIMSSVENQLRVSMEQSLVGSLSGVLIQSIPGTGRAVALAAGAVLVIRGGWTMGSLFAFQAYLSCVFGPAQFLASVNLQLQQARAALERVSALFDLVPEDMQSGGLSADCMSGEIEFRGVSFAYSGADYVLKDLSLQIRAGESVAIMGASGIGKTTLLSLLLRFYRPTTGEIYFDGRPVGAYALLSLRRCLGYVPQEPRLISGSILENLRYGNPDAGFEIVLRAARAAGIHETILAFPNGYQTQVGEGGAILSEGERQRLALARALIVEPDILILDEPTASLDAVSEQTIMDNLSEWRKGRTLVVVTHRLSTARRCDRVVFLDGDRIREGESPAEIHAKADCAQKLVTAATGRD